MSRLATKRPDEILVEYYFSLKGYPVWPDSFYQKNKIKFGRFLKPARDLLELCEGDIERAKSLLSKVAEKADKNGLEEWGIEWAISQYPEIVSVNSLK